MPTKIAPLLLLTLSVSACGTSNTVIEYVPKEVVKREYVGIPPTLLIRHCETLLLSDLVTQGDRDKALGDLWVCVQDHNEDKRKIQELSPH
jgi:hypothetical protein